MRQDCLAAAPRAGKVDRDYSFPGSFVGFDDGAISEDGRAVEQDINI
jgi:hypothetical protein